MCVLYDHMSVTYDASSCITWYIITYHMMHHQMVYKAQAEFLMNAVCCNDESANTGEADDLLECLKKIQVTILLHL